MTSVARLQAYFRHSARQRYETVSVPGFSLFFHPTDALVYFNYAIPDEAYPGCLDASLSMMRDEFAARGRRPRFEFIHEFAPRLASGLHAAGFAEEARQQLMVCTARTRRPAPDVLALTIAELTSASSVHEMQEYLTTQRWGFDPGSTVRASESDAEHFLRMMGDGRAYVASLKGQAVGVGMYTAPFDGVAEIVGLATLQPYQRRGIASKLTAQAVQGALEQGTEFVALVAADERAGRVYERVGFMRCATMLAYIGVR